MALKILKSLWNALKGIWYALKFGMELANLKKEEREEVFKVIREIREKREKAIEKIEKVREELEKEEKFKEVKEYVVCSRMKYEIVEEYAKRILKVTISYKVTNTCEDDCEHCFKITEMYDSTMVENKLTEIYFEEIRKLKEIYNAEVRVEFYPMLDLK